MYTVFYDIQFHAFYIFIEQPWFLEGDSTLILPSVIPVCPFCMTSEQGDYRRPDITTVLVQTTIDFQESMHFLMADRLVISKAN